MMITDGVKNLAIAGVKGGLNSGIKDDTKDILIEVANFDPVSVRKTARRLGIQTDASKRYENDLSPTLCDQAMREISSLIYEMCPESQFEAVVNVYPNPQEEKKISFSGEYISKILGIKISDEEIEKILKNYNYKFSKENNIFNIVAPDMRLDLVTPRDFVEEIGRVYGYEKIIPEIPKVESRDRDSNIWTDIVMVKQKLIDDGYKEVMTYAFGDKGEVEVLSALSGKNFLRTNLALSLNESISFNQKNLPLLGIDNIKIFEIGTIFSKDGECLNVVFGDKKNITEMSVEKFVSEKIPHEINKYNTLEKFLVEAILRSQKKFEEVIPQQVFKMWSVYPFITRDIAVWVPEGVDPQVLINIYKSFGTELLVREPKLFDSFTKDGKTSFAYRLVFQSEDKTLTDEEINMIMANITEKITSSGWEVR
jgi:phenylalanyl-tRNA synthetase beta chain